MRSQTLPEALEDEDYGNDTDAAIRGWEALTLALSPWRG